MVETSAFQRIVELPPDMTLLQLVEAFPPDRFRLTYKPDGVIRIQRRDEAAQQLHHHALAVVASATTTGETTNGN